MNKNEHALCAQRLLVFFKKSVLDDENDARKLLHHRRRNKISATNAWWARTQPRPTPTPAPARATGGHHHAYLLAASGLPASDYYLVRSWRRWLLIFRTCVSSSFTTLGKLFIWKEKRKSEGNNVKKGGNTCTCETKRNLFYFSFISLDPVWFI
jgi:hypothetical protein